jgi:hypothetical protein
VFGVLRSNLAWLLANPASAAVVGVSLLGGSLAGVPVANQAYTYMWRDPDFCADCHVHDYANEAWAHSVHSRLTTCHDCHEVPIHHYPINLYRMVFDRPRTPEDIPPADVGIVLCEQCHTGGQDKPLTGPLTTELRAQVVHIDDSPLHRVHLDAKNRRPSTYQGGHPDEPAGRIECLDCHGGADRQVHRFTSTSEECEACHQDLRPADESGRSMNCIDCHARGFVGHSDKR